MACADCFKGSVHEGNPVGRAETIHGRDTYISDPPAGVTPKAIVVILSDGVGWTFENTRILADKFASEGFLVYLPDFLGGHATRAWVMDPMNRLTTEGGIMGWLWKPWYLAKVIAGISPMIKFSIFNDPWPSIKAYFEAIRNDSTSKDFPIAVAGYCWGGTYATRLVHDDAICEATERPLADVAFSAHPGSMVVPMDAEKVVRPLSFAVGDNDMMNPMVKIEKFKQVLENKRENGEVDAEVVIYPGAGHGFGTRSDLADKALAKHYNDATAQALQWFLTHI